MKKLKVGDKIVAIDPCRLLNDGPARLTVGKEYRINSVLDGGFIINNDRDKDHIFLFEEFSKYFKLPETEQPNKFYPFAEEVEMLVWDNKEEWAVKRTVFGRKGGKFLAWNSNSSLLSTPWNNAKPLPQPVTVTMQEIADWKGVNVEQIKIEG